MDFNYELKHQHNKVDYLKECAELHPIAILLDPYMNERDLIDFVKKTYKEYIEPLQKKYRDPKLKINRIRNKNPRIKERNKFIYDHRDMHITKLTSLVSEKFRKTLDYTYVQRILTNEIRKRNL
jgi:hypothetical protein